jgi:hypothetical protein
MTADDALLFIDANKYLDLYRIALGKKLLAPLGEQINYIFVTQQVVAEVQRNKIQVAADFLRAQFKELKIQTFNIPDHLSGTGTEQGKNILQQMKEVKQQIDKLNVEVESLALGIMEQISSSEDEVSKALTPIFAKAVPHSPEELQRARERKELGNPPGKNTNPIGDQLTWEQILTHFEGKKRLWIISRDGDYGTVYEGKSFPNHFLYSELCKIVSNPKIYIFEDLVKGIEHFVKETGINAENCLTPEETEEIKQEEKSLPYLDALLSSMSLTQQIPSTRLSQAFFDSLPISTRAHLLGKILPLGELTHLSRAIDTLGLEPEAITLSQKIIEINKLSRALANASPTSDLTRFSQTVSDASARVSRSILEQISQMHQSPEHGQVKQDDQSSDTSPLSQKGEEKNKEESTG